MLLKDDYVIKLNASYYWSIFTAPFYIRSFISDWLLLSWKLDSLAEQLKISRIEYTKLRIKHDELDDTLSDLRTALKHLNVEDL